MPDTPTNEGSQTGRLVRSPSAELSVKRKASDAKRGPWKRLTPQERLLVKGVASGLSINEAGRRAGYSEASTRGTIYRTIELTHIKSALTDAIDRAGLSDDRLAQVLHDALSAKRTIVGGSVKAPVIREVDDHDVRLRAYDRVAAAKGLVPKVCDLPEAPAPAVEINIIERGARSPVVVSGGASAVELDCGEGVEVAISQRGGQK